MVVLWWVIKWFPLELMKCIGLSPLLCEWPQMLVCWGLFHLLFFPLLLSTMLLYVPMCATSYVMLQHTVGWDQIRRLARIVRANGKAYSHPVTSILTQGKVNTPSQVGIQDWKPKRPKSWKLWSWLRVRQAGASSMKPPCGSILQSWSCSHLGSYGGPEALPNCYGKQRVSVTMGLISGEIKTHF